MNKIEIGGYTRISKSAAKKAFNNGENVYMLPCKVSPNSYWIIPVKMSRKERLKTEINNGIVSVVPRNDLFECECNEFSYYNCNNNETGNYIAFYVKEK